MPFKPYVLWVFLFFAVAVVLCTPFVGIQYISPRLLFSGVENSVEVKVFWQMRVPRTLVSFLAGAGLAMSGFVFQSMFRNPLATPFTLGISGGASLGAVLALRLGWSFVFLGMSSTVLCAFSGALGAILLVYGLTRLRGDFSTFRLLLAGVAVNAFFSSLILVVNYTANMHDAMRLMRWLMGALTVNGYRSVVHMAPFVMAGGGILLLFTRELRLISTGDALAHSRGVNVVAMRHLFFLATSLMVGSIVAICGPVGFIGLIAPHICRLMLGAGHRLLMPATLLFGGAFLTLCDAAARWVVAPAEMPVGVLTALLGGPFFIYLLLTTSDRHV